MSETARRMCSWFLTFLIALSVMLPSALDVAFAQDSFTEPAYAQASDGDSGSSPTLGLGSSRSKLTDVDYALIFATAFFCVLWIGIAAHIICNKFSKHSEEHFRIETEFLAHPETFDPVEFAKQRKSNGDIARKTAACGLACLGVWVLIFMGYSLFVISIPILFVLFFVYSDAVVLWMPFLTFIAVIVSKAVREIQERRWIDEMCASFAPNNKGAQIVLPTSTKRMESAAKAGKIFSKVCLALSVVLLVAACVAMFSPFASNVSANNSYDENDAYQPGPDVVKDPNDSNSVDDKVDGLFNTINTKNTNANSNANNNNSQSSQTNKPTFFTDAGVAQMQDRYKTTFTLDPSKHNKDVSEVEVTAEDGFTYHLYLKDTFFADDYYWTSRRMDVLYPLYDAASGIVTTLAEQHGASMRVESVDIKGTVPWVTPRDASVSIPTLDWGDTQGIVNIGMTSIGNSTQADAQRECQALADEIARNLHERYPIGFRCPVHVTYVADCPADMSVETYLANHPGANSIVAVAE